MIIVVTSIKLRSLFGFFRLSYQGLKIVRQTRQQKGFVSMKNTGFGYMHYTLSAWESLEAMKDFARSGAHLESMQYSAKLSTEIRIYTYEGSALPSWAEAKKLVSKQGKSYTYK